MVLSFEMIIVLSCPQQQQVSTLVHDRPSKNVSLVLSNEHSEALKEAEECTKLAKNGISTAIFMTKHTMKVYDKVMMDDRYTFMIDQDPDSIHSDLANLG